MAGLGIDCSKVYEKSKEFHSKTKLYKENYLIGMNMRHAGYVPFSEKGMYSDEIGRRRYESFDLSLEKKHDNNELNIFNGPINWPDIHEFRNIVYKYFTDMIYLSGEISKIMEISLKVEPGSIHSKMTHPTSQLRLLHYIENDDSTHRQDMNMGAHTDYECFTILHQDSPGLQSQTRQGIWVDVPPIEKTFVMNIGDMLECLTNGYWKSNAHRVINRQKERFSIPFFASFNFNESVAPLKEYANRGDSSIVYKKIIAGEHLLEQVARDFTYLRNLNSSGDIKLQNGLPDSNFFQATVNMEVEMYD